MAARCDEATEDLHFRWPLACFICFAIGPLLEQTGLRGRRQGTSEDAASWHVQKPRETRLRYHSLASRTIKESPVGTSFSYVWSITTFGRKTL